MRKAALVAFGVGYVMGARAGRGRYRQILDVAQRVGDRLERYATGATDGGVASSERQASRRTPERDPEPVSDNGVEATGSSRSVADDDAIMAEFERLATPRPLLEQPQV